MNDDQISRQAAIDAIVNTVSEIGLHDNSEVARYGATFRQHEIIDIIEGLPSAQPDFSCDGCKTPKHICGICMRNYPNITDHYCAGEWAERREE